MKKTDVKYPPYYIKPFHAYEDGNLCLEAALEVSMAAKSVHALVMDPAGKELDPEYVISHLTDRQPLLSLVAQTPSERIGL